jgi:hypothetical protein
MKGRTKAFPIPPSLSQKVYQPFEYLSADILDMKTRSYRRYKYIALFVDKLTSFIMHTFMEKKNESIIRLQEVLRDYSPDNNPKSSKTRFLLTDYDTVITDKRVQTYLKENNITLLSSAPHKHQQNLIERYVQTIKDGIRTIMCYNNTPRRYWCYATKYYCYNYNHIPRYDKNTSRYEDFTGEKPDISHFVPFYE